MKLWILTYDLIYPVGCVVRAETEQDARQLAAEQDDRFLDVDYSNCEEITIEGNAEVLIRYNENE